MPPSALRPRLASAPAALALLASAMPVNAQTEVLAASEPIPQSQAPMRAWPRSKLRAIARF